MSTIKVNSRQKAPSKNLASRILQFVREVIAELRKTIWPNHVQTITYTGVVLVFLTFMVTSISLVDLASIKGITWLIG